MYKVAVVDDEDIIVQGLVKTMPWAKYQCEVIATASDGYRALKMIRTEQPDILFTDIQMPNMDGLSMIAAVRSEYPEMQVTILSGYPNFEYAQRAISLGVSRYVLKPSRFAELEEALAQMVKHLEALAAEREAAQQSDGNTASGNAASDAGKAGGTGTDAAGGNAAGNTAGGNTAGGNGTGNTASGNTANGASDTTGDTAGADSPIETAQNFIVHNAQAYIRAHYAEKLTLSDVAEQVYVSQWHLSKLISRYTQQSFFDLLNGARIDKAKELLADPALRVWEISEMVGFAEVTHFSRIFKKIVGMSANEYRSQHLTGK